MKVTLEIGGGLVPSRPGRPFVVDSSTLSAADRQALEEAVKAASAERVRAGNPLARDARSFEITVQSEEGTRRIVAEDGAMPPNVRALINKIQALAASSG